MFRIISWMVFFGMLGGLFPTTAFADRWHNSIFLSFGDDYFWDNYHGRQFFGYRRIPRRHTSTVYIPIIKSPPQKIIYIEKPIKFQPVLNHTATTPQKTDHLEAGYWYYCAPTQSYYPYVRTCSKAWQKISPTPRSSP